MNQWTTASGTPKPLASEADLRARLERGLAGMQEVMGPLPEAKRGPLDVYVEDDQQHGDLRVRTLSYRSEPGCRTPAFVVEPSAEPERPRSAVLCLHGRAHRHGNRCVVDLSGDEATGLACELARRGHCVIAPCYPNMVDYDVDLAALGYRSTSMKAVWDNLRALDLLDELPQVHHGRYAAIGASMGGYNSLFTAAFDRRLIAVACGCGFDSFVDYMGGDLSVWGDPWHLPRILDYPPGQVPFDFHDVIALIAPRPCFLSSPLHDRNFSSASAARVVAAARLAYRWYDADERLVFEQPDAGHAFPPESVARGIALIEAALAE